MLGDPPALIGMTVICILLFGAAAAFMQTAFLRTYQDGRAADGPRRRQRRGLRPVFRSRLLWSVIAKEWQLLVRDPALAFQIVLQLAYLLPLALIFWRSGAAAIAPALAIANVVLLGNLAASVAWLTLSAEDVPELIATAPVEQTRLGRAKLLAAMAIVAPVAAILPLAMLPLPVAGAAITLVATLGASYVCGLIERAMGKPAKRASYRSSRGGSRLAVTLLQSAIVLVIGFIAAGLTAVLTGIG